MHDENFEPFDAAEIDAATMLAMRDDPVSFIRLVLGAQLWSKQADVAESVRDHKRTIVASCHGVGKTMVAARIALWWLYTRPFSVVITTAPTLRQVVKQLWKEIRAAYDEANKRVRGGAGGNLLPKAPELQFDGERWQLVGYSTDGPDSFQGWHSEGGNLFIFDEATGIDPDIWKAANGCLTSEKDRLLAIGNPTDPTSEFKRQYDSDSALSNSIAISAFDSPNVANGEEIVPGLVSRAWVEEMQDECGPSYESHPDYLSRVLGVFPDADDRALVPVSWFDAAVERWTERNEKNQWGGSVSLGVDVARKGSNKTVIAEAYPKKGVRALHKEPAQTTMETAGRILQLANELSASTVNIDADGIGAGVADRCAEIDPSKTMEMRGGMKSDVVDKDGNPKYLNKRAEWYWTLRDKLDPQYEHAIALPPDKALRAQLTSIRWGTNSRGLLKIESKDEMAKRGIKSPDEADSVVYALAEQSQTSYNVLDHLSALARL